MTKLTPRQQEILDFIRNTLEVLGAPPTRMEISSAFGFASPNAAEDHLKALAKKGAIVLEQVDLSLGAGAWLYRHVEARPWGAWGAQKMAGIGMVLLPFLAVCAGFTWAFSY